MNTFDRRVIVGAGGVAEVHMRCITVDGIGAFPAEPVKGLYHYEISDGANV
jgi:hypothetical protein